MSQRKRRRPAALSRRLRIERLEDRRMLATFTVTSNTDIVDPDDGVVTLREAVGMANALPDADEINFDFGHDGPETIRLTQLAESTNDGNSALVISSNLTITGPGAELLTIDASPLDSTPDENDGQEARLSHLDNGSTSHAGALAQIAKWPKNVLEPRRQTVLMNAGT